MRRRQLGKSARSAGYSLLALLLLTLCFVPIRYARGTDSETSLLETGKPVNPSTKPPLPNEIKIVSYNMRWRGGEDLRALIKLLKEDKEIGGASVIGLQEVDRNKKRTDQINTARKMAEELGMHYAWTAPPPALGKERQEEETGVAILSPYPLTDVTHILLPNEGPGGRRRVALGATIHIGEKSIRVYSIHAELRMSNEKRLEQLDAVLDDHDSLQGQIEHAVVLGDFNTPMPKDVRGTSRLFTERGFQTPFSNDDATWRTFIIKLKLDWLWLRGLDVKTFGIDKKIELSDHWPLWVVAKI